MTRDNHDLLIDQLLRETLGGDRPRDMTARVMAHVRIMDRFRFRSWIATGSAIAAGIAIVVSLYMYWPRAYPNPTADAQVAVMDNGVVQRGANLYTGAEGGTLNLGGYVECALAPQTALSISGGQYEEKVLLYQGQLDVLVAKSKGQFDIGVGPATVHVTGTQFTVRVADEITSAARNKTLYVAVKEGSVEVRNIPGAAGIQTLTKGQEQHFKIATISTTPPKPNVEPPGATSQPATRGARGPGPTATRGTGPTTRGGPASRGAPPSTYANTTATRPLQLTVQLTPGNTYREGRVNRTGSVFYLATNNGYFYMFEQGAITSAHVRWLSLSPDVTWRVIWTQGVVTDIISPTTTYPGTSTQTK